MNRIYDSLKVCIKLLNDFFHNLLPAKVYTNLERIGIKPIYIFQFVQNFKLNKV